MQDEGFGGRFAAELWLSELEADGWAANLWETTGGIRHHRSPRDTPPVKIDAAVPTIHLQTSADLPENTSISDILETLVATLSSIESIDPKAVKAYHTLRSVWVMGSGAQPGFAACEIAVLTGRPDDVRVKIADTMFAALKTAFAQSASAGEISLTLEVREMDKPTYRK